MFVLCCIFFGRVQNEWCIRSFFKYFVRVLVFLLQLGGEFCDSSRNVKPAGCCCCCFHWLFACLDSLLDYRLPLFFYSSLVTARTNLSSHIFLPLPRGLVFYNMGNAASAKRSQHEPLGGGDFDQLNQLHYHQQAELEGFLTEAKQKFEELWTSPPKATRRVEDYDRIKTLGTGSYGRVMMVRHRETGEMRAMKILEKRKVVRLKQVVGAWLLDW